MYTTQNTSPNINDTKWKETVDNTFSFEIDDNTYYAYLKNQNNDVFPINDVPLIGRITEINTNTDKIYLALKDTFQLDVSFKSIGNTKKDITYTSDNESVATVDNNGVVKAIKKGTTKIHVKIDTEDKEIDVVVTSLIVKKPKEFNNSKPYVPCGKHTKADNDLLDEILKHRINKAGYKTRAGVVEAARFLTLEFPYRIRYFSENGNVATNGIDSEGRYYHQGLYLHKSRYTKISKSFSGPKTWGCKLYSRPAHGNRPNGLDCSGWVSWVILNGGYNVGDLGAGVTSNKDLTDIGKRTVFTKELTKNGKVKVGDLLSAGGVSGGHIAIIIGEDNKNYYVAESLWTYPTIGVVVMKYHKKTIYKTFYYVILMDDYYKKDGNITEMWY